MGQFGNQPDFATNDIKAIVPSADINTTTFLNASVIYIGDNQTLGTELKVIPAGTVGPSVINGFSSAGYSGSEGTGYANANAVATAGGSGANLTVDITALNGAVQTVVVNVAGTGYLNGDLITITGAGGNAVFRIKATPGLPTAAQAVTFKGLGTGGFLPVTVDYVLTTALSCGALIAAR